MQPAERWPAYDAKSNRAIGIADHLCDTRRRAAQLQNMPGTGGTVYEALRDFRLFSPFEERAIGRQCRRGRTHLTRVLEIRASEKTGPFFRREA